MNRDIGVVIVTYNRLDKLKYTLECFEKQSKVPSYIVVVNNASTDGTYEFLLKWKNNEELFKKQVVNMAINTGGSGGFYRGLEVAIQKEPDWIWVQDDDAFPEKEAMERTKEFIYYQREMLDSISAIASQVINNGKTDYNHRVNYSNNGSIKRRPSKASDYKKEMFEINGFSYVGTVINKNKLREVGLTNKDLFIWYDDTEHSIRLSRVGQIICVPSIKVHHNVSSDNNLSWKFYYGVRNLAYLYKTQFSYFSYKKYSSMMMAVAFLAKIKKEEEKARMINTALHDVEVNKLGVHSVYKPGWKLDNSNGGL